MHAGRMFQSRPSACVTKVTPFRQRVCRTMVAFAGVREARSVMIRLKEGELAVPLKLRHVETRGGRGKLWR